MVKCYIITNPGVLKDHEAIKENKRKFGNIIKMIGNEYKLNTNYYVEDARRLTVKVQDNEMKFFKHQLLKDSTMRFNKKTLIHRRFDELIREHQVTNCFKPHIWTMFNTTGHSISESFKCEGILYCKISDINDFQPQIDGFNMIGYKLYTEKQKIAERGI